MKRITADVIPQSAMTPDEIEKFVTWVSSIRNDFDPDVVLYPRTVFCRALCEGEPIVYVPLHPVLMYESLAPRPDLSDLQRAVSIREITYAVEDMAGHTGHREAYCLTNSREEMQMAIKRGWKVALYDPERGVWLVKRKFVTTKP